MSDIIVDPRMLRWLADGPTRAPAATFETIMGAVATVPQERPALRLLGGRIRVRPQALAAAAVVVAVTAGGVALLREPILDALAPPRTPTDLLYAFPDTRTILEASGGPAGADLRTVIGTLPEGGAFVIAATCTGGGEITVEVVDPGIMGPADGSGEAGASAPSDDAVARPSEQPEPYRRLVAPCDDQIATTTYQTTGFQPSGQALEVHVVADAGATWRVAVGQLRDLPGEPAFPSVNPAEGMLLLIDAPPVLVTGPPEASGGIGLDPAGARSVTVLVQCLGDPITIWSDGGSGDAVGDPIERVACDDAGRTVEVQIDTTGVLSARAVSDGFTWVHLAAAAPPGAVPDRPAAPALPAGLGGVLFAEGDGESVAFGSLGGNRQTIVRIDQSNVGQPGGGFVAIAHPDDGGRTVLELWSLTDAAPVRTLATLNGANVFDSWVDATHEQVFYGMTTQLGAGEWRRIGFDGTGDTLVAGVPVASVREAVGTLAADDRQFVVQWCPLVGACERVVYDTASGEDTRLTRTDDGACVVMGVVGGRLVALGPTCEESPGGQRITAQDVGGGPATTLLEGYASGSVFVGSDGPQVLVVEPGDTQTVVEVVGVDGSGRREVARIDHEPGISPGVSRLRLPAGDWVLLAGVLGEVQARHVLTPSAVLLNVATGERIGLPNLPGE